MPLWAGKEPSIWVTRAGCYRGSGRMVIVAASANIQMDTRMASEAVASTEFATNTTVATRPDQPNHRGGVPCLIEIMLTPSMNTMRAGPIISLKPSSNTHRVLAT